MIQGRDLIFDRPDWTEEEAALVDKTESELSQAKNTSQLCGKGDWGIIFKSYVFVDKKGRRSVVLSIGWKTIINAEKYGSYFFIKNPRVDASAASSLIATAKKHSERALSKIGVLARTTPR